MPLKIGYDSYSLQKIKKLNTFKATFFLLAVLFLSFPQVTFATEPTEGDDHGEDPVEAMMHHLGDANEFHIFGDVSIPLPCIAWSEDGLMVTLSSTFAHGAKAYNGYVMHHGLLMKVIGEGFPKEGLVDVTFGGENHGHDHDAHGAHDHGHDAHGDHQTVDAHGVHTPAGAEDAHAEEHAHMVMYNGKTYTLEACKALQNTSATWYDFSITKNVFAMLLGLLILFFLFSKVAKAYANPRQAPKGVQSFLEPLILFMRDEVAKPAIGKEWKKYFPFIMCLFFFILIVNLLGLVPFFPGSANVTGNIGVTIVLAVMVFLVVNFSGNKHYWGHILWMPGIPTFVKPLMTVIEIVGVFMKPATLFIRLFANITAGHIIILSLVSLIFFFSKMGGMAGGVAGMGLAVPFVFALNLLELFVAFLQAFVFSLLAALYIGSAVEEHHHEEAHH